MEENKHRAGFVNIVGKPNAGKSTLCNALVGEQLSIITPKASTTRHRILGILNSDDYQCILSDTPGIIEPAYKLHENMMEQVSESIEDADVLIVLADVNNCNFNENHISLIQKSKCPKIVMVNKIDTATQQKVTEVMAKLSDLFKPVETFAISALHGISAEGIIKVLVSYLPTHPPYFPKDQLTDRNTRFYVSEIIREKIFNQYDKEIPYSTEVFVHDYIEQANIDKIYAYIIVERNSQKGIIIGANGNDIKKVGIAARKDIEAFVGKKVFLDLRVKVISDWRNNENKFKH